tara:strand:- start:114 stop:674 length:561 start_codon:yes stop_codon:yes gene_type:complete
MEITKQIEIITQGVKECKEIKIPTIKSNKDYKRASDSVKFINDKLKYAESERKKMVAPLVKEKKEIDSAFKPLTVPMKSLMTNIKGSMLNYMKKKELEQAKYEQKKIEETPDEHTLVVDDKVRKIKDSEFSSNTKKTIIKYKIKDKQLENVITIKQQLMKEYLLAGNPLPDYIETYTEESIVVRTK